MDYIFISIYLFPFCLAPFYALSFPHDNPDVIDCLPPLYDDCLYTPLTLEYNLTVWIQIHEDHRKRLS